MDAILTRAPALQGTLTVPPDKAICHRVTLLAAVAEGVTEIRPWPTADDCQRTASLIEALGAQPVRASDSLRIVGTGSAGLAAPSAPIFCGESGTTLRLAAGLLAGQPFVTTLTAGPRLARRPMRRIVTPLARMGAQIHGTQPSDQPEEVYPPLTIRGRQPLRGIRYEMEVASAQVKSAILLAGLRAEGRTTVVERLPTRDHTERALGLFGARVDREGPCVSVLPTPLRSPGTVQLPGDFSSAAFFIVAALCIPGSKLVVREVSLNPSRTGLLEILNRMGAAVRIDVTSDGWEPHGTLTVETCQLRGTTVEPHEVPAMIDELPVLMVAAACAEGPTRLHGVGELRVKETDRIASMVRGLRQLGARIRQPAPDTVEIERGALTAGVVDSANDHRTAMSLAVAGLIAAGEATTVRQADCVAKSFPEFFEHLRRVCGPPTVKTVDKARGLC